MNSLFEESKSLQPYIIEIRRHLHQFPELSFEETNTAEFIKQQLTELGVEYHAIGGTGVVAHLGKGERCVALRADIDALPIQEETGLVFASRHDGIMHACGHDAHTAMLLGAAKLLKRREAELKGVVKLIFQPGEEKTPGGASILIREGVLQNPVPEVIFGQHVNPDASAGTVAFVNGTMMASTDELYWTLHGKSGHAAQPHRATDSILMAAHLITQLQALVSRSLNPLESGVLSITGIHAGSATNIIPETVTMYGTLRSMNQSWREWALQTIEQHTRLLAQSPLFPEMDIQFLPQCGYPPLVNNDTTTNFARLKAQELLGTQNVESFEPKMWGEDFAFYTHHIPGTFWMLGVKTDAQDVMHGLHNSRFIPDESAFYTGVAMMAFMATEWLSLP